MKYFISIAILSLLSLASWAEPKEEALGWLEQIDLGRYVESWDDAAPYFQQQLSREEWQKAAEAVRKPLGGIISRELAKRSQHGSLPGLPDGNYVIMNFSTRFENKMHATETVTLMRTQEGWEAVGYFIN